MNIFKHKQPSTKTRQIGFTLVEFTAVIIILGVLTATALPRFISLRKEAIVSSMHGLNAAIQSASTLAYAKAITTQVDQLATSTINVDGEIIDLVYGYPSGTANGIAKLVTTPSDDWKQRASSISGAWLYWHDVINEDASSASCYIRYNQATSAGARPIVNFSQSGCRTAN